MNISIYDSGETFSNEGHPTMKRAAIYLRVSTKDQTTENQLRELQDCARNAGWEIVAVYEDYGVSGSKGRDQRPEYDRLLKDATRRKFDVVMAWSVDRLGRSLRDLVGFLEELHGLKVDLFLHKQGIDTTTAAGKALFGMMGVFAEFERAMIQDRVKAGLDRAKANGVKLGRPAVSNKMKEAVIAGKANGDSLRKIAKDVGLSLGKVHGIIKEADKKELVV